MSSIGRGRMLGLELVSHGPGWPGNRARVLQQRRSEEHSDSLRLERQITLVRIVAAGDAGFLTLRRDSPLRS